VPIKVSIITVCYNSAAHIADALRSVDEQTHADIEHIIVDGASTDGTLELLQKAQRPGRLVVSERDKGIYDAMNKGLRRATGDIIGFLNADDFFASPDTVNRIVSQFEADEAVDAVYGDLEYVSADRLDRSVRYWRAGEFQLSELAKGWMPPHPTFYMRRRLQLRVGEFDTQYRIAADYDYMVRCMTSPQARLAYLPQVLVRMRLGGVSNASAKTMLRKSREDLRVMRTHGIGGLWSLVIKNLRKLPQFVARRMG
jgi:glycosyltransferase